MLRTSIKGLRLTFIHLNRFFILFYLTRNESEALANLKYFIIHGNTTVYEWRTGIAPKTIEKPKIQYDFDEEPLVESTTEDFAEIDFGLTDEAVLVEVRKLNLKNIMKN